jgi:hypothetical protein
MDAIFVLTEETALERAFCDGKISPNERIRFAPTPISH